MIPSKLLNIYKKTHFFVRDSHGKKIRFTFKTASRLPFFKIKKFAVLTAWNPGLQKHSLKQNRLQNQKLKMDLKKAGYIFYKTLGYYRAHAEESFTVEGISKSKALKLGKKHKQYAILYHDSQGVQFLRC